MADEKLDELPPCHYCGARAEAMPPETLKRRWVVWCARCGATGPCVGPHGYVKTKEEAVRLYKERGGTWGVRVNV